MWNEHLKQEINVEILTITYEEVPIEGQPSYPVYRTGVDGDGSTLVEAYVPQELVTENRQDVALGQLHQHFKPDKIFFYIVIGVPKVRFLHLDL